MEEKEQYAIEKAPQVQLGMLAVAPNDVVAEGTRIATSLAKIITDRKLFTQIGKNKHVHVEGWNTMGAMMGILPREVPKSIVRLEDGGYEAAVELIRVSDGMRVGYGSAICGMDEVDQYGKPTWADRPEFARRSMAITRASGKAWRLGFSWIMKLAGYDATPFEEMPDVIEEKPNISTKKQSNNTGSNQPGTRPYRPEIVRERILERAPEYAGSRKDEKRPGGTLSTFIAWQMSECFQQDPNSDGKRIAVLNYIFGSTESTNDLNGAQLKALEWWLGPGEYEGPGAGITPRKEAIKEAKAMYAARLKEQGQQELDIENNDRN